MLKLDAIKERLAAATPEPWQMTPQSYETGECGDRAVAVTKGRFIAEVAFNDDEQKANALLITNAPTDLVQLVAEVERLRLELAARNEYLRRIGIDPSRFKVED